MTKANETKSDKEQKTLVTFLLDRTGSMQSIRDETIEAFNGYLKELKGSSGNIHFTLIQFDSDSMDKIYVDTPIDDVAELTRDTYQPRAQTPLIDAAYQTIKAVEKQKAAKGCKIVVCFQTDGEENASALHTWADLKELVVRKMAEGWQFNFMGTGIDAYDQSARMGLAAAQTVASGRSRHHVGSAYQATGQNIADYARGARLHTGYSGLQKASAGDRYAPDLKLDDAQKKSDSKTPPTTVDNLTL